MRTSTKITIGLSIAAVAGISAAVMASGKVIEKLHHTSNRCKARKFVEKKFGGNEKVMDIVDKLSDEDLESVMNVAGKLKQSKEKIHDYGDSVKDTTSDLKDKLVGYLTDMVG